MNHKLKIAHIVFSSRMWGVENYILNLASALARHNVETWVLCCDPNVQTIYEKQGIHTFHLRLNGYLDVPGIISLAKFCREQNIDILHTHLGIDSLVASIVMKFCNIICVMSVHFLEPTWASAGNITATIWRTIQIWKNHRISHFIPITQQVGDALFEREQVDRNRMTAVSPGIPTMSASEEAREIMRSSLGLAADECMILTLSRLEQEKNIATLIDLAAEIVSIRKGVKFFLAGDGSQRQTLEKQVAERNLQEHFKFLGYRRDAHELLQAADIFVLTASAEPFGMSAVEAMFAKRPVVGFGNAGLSFIVRNEETGFLIKSGDLVNFKSQVLRLLDDADLRRNFGLAGYKHAMANFTDEIMAVKILEVYNNVLSSKTAKEAQA